MSYKLTGNSTLFARKRTVVGVVQQFFLCVQVLIKLFLYSGIVFSIVYSAGVVVMQYILFTCERITYTECMWLSVWCFYFKNYLLKFIIAIVGNRVIWLNWFAVWICYTTNFIFRSTLENWSCEFLGNGCAIASCVIWIWRCNSFIGSRLCSSRCTGPNNTVSIYSR